uniref:Uncharacterized protein n=1 Tax=Noctiluca scintillans TaxID=2966 RepID=A0A7S1F9A6_NOCSC|mmetsp:Transcript_43026/g.113377  ORF Transcript_43026/g.113377 Transcript_43026/m.113377 type:complete len:156 (+) Transcript_43026:50-517(+)
MMFRYLSCNCCHLDGRPTEPITKISGVGFESNELDYEEFQANPSRRDILDLRFAETFYKTEGLEFHEFSVELDRSTGKKMGLAVRQDLALSMLQVMSVDEEEDTAVGDWNAAHPEDAVRVKDFICGVNGSMEMLEIIDECKSSQLLHVRVKRVIS